MTRSPTHSNPGERQNLSRRHRAFFPLKGSRSRSFAPPNESAVVPASRQESAVVLETVWRRGPLSRQKMKNCVRRSLVRGSFERERCARTSLCECCGDDEEDIRKIGGLTLEEVRRLPTMIATSAPRAQSTRRARSRRFACCGAFRTSRRTAGRTLKLLRLAWDSAS
jgi:hypothetical protein